MFLTKQFVGRTIALCDFRWEETVKLEFDQRADLVDIRRIGIPRAFQERGVHPGDRCDARSAAPELRLPYSGALPHVRHADLGRGFGYASRGVLRHDCDEKDPSMKAYLGIDTGFISTKGVVVDENKEIIARSCLWTEGDPSGAVRRRHRLVPFGPGAPSGRRGGGVRLDSAYLR